MSFHYNVRPGNAGKVTTNPHFQGTRSEAEHLVAVAAAAGISAVQAEAALKAHYQLVIADARDTIKYDNLLDLVDIQPTSGGSHADSSFPSTVANIRPNISWALSKAGRATFETGMTFVRASESGLKTPIIDSAKDLSTGQPDAFTLGKAVLLEGELLDFDPADVTQGVFLSNPNVPTPIRVPASDYVLIEPSQIRFLIAAAPGSPATVTIKAKMNGSIRSYIYPTPLETTN